MDFSENRHLQILHVSYSVKTKVKRSFTLSLEPPALFWLYDELRKQHTKTLASPRRLYIPRRGRYTIKLVCGTYRAKKGSKDWTKKTEKYFQCKIVPAGALRVTANQRSHISRRGRVVSGESPGALSQVMGNTELTTRNRSVEFDDWWTLRMLRVMTFHTECSNLHRKSRPPSCHLCTW